MKHELICQEGIDARVASFLIRCTAAIALVIIIAYSAAGSQ